MVYIKFENSENVYVGTVFIKSQNVLSLDLETQISTNASGFKTYRDIGMTKLMGNFTDYTTVYDDESFSLSNDGSVKPIVECNISFTIDETQGSLIGESNFTVEYRSERSDIEPPTVSANENYQFNGWNPSFGSGEVTSSETYVAEIEYVPTLSEVIEAKVTEMNEMQQLAIQAGVDVTLTDGTIEHFELTDHDQASLTGLQTQVLAGVEQLPWHTSDNAVQCKYYTNADMLLIASSAMGCVTYHVTYFRDLRIMIRDMTDKEVINAVTYGMYIPLEYQSEVLRDLYSALGITNE